MSKYHNRKTDGFDSQAEANRYYELLLLQRAGRISDLQCQVKFRLLPAQYVGKKCIFKAVDYVADFTYYDETGEYVVEDVKGYRTDVYKLKAKMMYYFHHIRIKET